MAIKENTELSIIAANGNWNDNVPFTLDVSDGELDSVIYSVVLSHDNMWVAGYPFANSQVVTSNFSVTITKNKLTTTLPKHSIFFFRASLAKVPGGASATTNLKIVPADETRLGRMTFSNPSRVVRRACSGWWFCIELFRKSNKALKLQREGDYKNMSVDVLKKSANFLALTFDIDL